jgi:hypothetical protein
LTIDTARVTLCQVVAGELRVRLVDIAVMFVSCWLLASMAIDVLTPKEFTVYMAAAAIAPATIVSALLYWLRIPTLDFAVVFSVLWLISAMVLVMIAPKPLSPFLAIAAAVPLMVVGVVVNFQCWRRSKPSFKSAEGRQVA